MPTPYTRPAYLSPRGAVFDPRIGNDPRIEPAVEVNGDLKIARLSGGRPQGLRGLPRKLELQWIAGAQGLPQLNAVTDLPSGDTFNTASFLANLNADHHWEVLGSGAVSSDVTYSAEGGINLATHGGGTNTTYLAPHLNTNQSPWTVFTWGSDQEATVEFDIATGSSIANNVVIYAGFKLTGTSVMATDADQAYFRFSSGQSSGHWEGIYSIADSDNVIDSGVTVAASTRYHLKVAIDSARVPHFYIGAGLNAATTLVGSGTALTDATDFIPYVGILEASAAVKNLRVLGIAASRLYA
jgi:hypothetical protein